MRIDLEEKERGLGLGVQPELEEELDELLELEEELVGRGGPLTVQEIEESSSVQRPSSKLQQLHLPSKQATSSPEHVQFNSLPSGVLSSSLVQLQGVPLLLVGVEIKLQEPSLSL